MSYLFRRVVPVLALACAAPVAQAQGAAPCAAPAFRAFDFWLGAWEVRTPAGAVAGTSRISSILGGCAIREEYTGQAPYRGESLNAWDTRTRRWHQTWMDNGGLVATFDGGLRDGHMVLEGDGADPQGKPFRGRMTFTPLPDGRVRQHWERSYDAGTTWSTMFDGYYTRKPAP